MVGVRNAGILSFQPATDGFPLGTGGGGGAVLFSAPALLLHPWPWAPGNTTCPPQMSTPPTRADTSQGA